MFVEREIEFAPLRHGPAHPRTHRLAADPLVVRIVEDRAADDRRSAVEKGRELLVLREFDGRELRRGLLRNRAQATENRHGEDRGGQTDVGSHQRLLHGFCLRVSDALAPLPLPAFRGSLMRPAAPAGRGRDRGSYRVSVAVEHRARRLPSHALRNRSSLGA
jgi:hypothetical protein